MVKKRKKKPAPRNTHTPPDQYDFIQHCAKLLKARVAAGVYRDRPGLEAAIIDFDPAIALIEIAADPASTPDMRAAVSAKLMPFWHKEQLLLVKEHGDGPADHNVVVIVQPWASGPRRIEAAPAAIEPPLEVRTGEDTPVEAEVVEPVEDPKRIVGFTPQGVP